MAYQVGRDYSGTLEKKNALGIWTKKFVSLTSTTLGIADSEGAPPAVSIDIGNILRGGEGSDPLVIVLVTHQKPDEKTQLKGADKKTADYWYDLIRNALEACGRQKSRMCGLPDVDPRHGLKFELIPPQHLAKFAQLDGAVLYWFSPVKKYGAKSLVGRHSTEERITFVTDKCLFVTKPDSEVTRCMRITLMTALFTNIDVREKPTDEVFVVVKMKEPDYDLYFACPEAAQFVHVLCTLHKHLTKGKELAVSQVKATNSEGVNMQLSRRGNFEMKVVVPLQKHDLKIALDAFAKERGITFSKSGQIKRAKSGSMAKGAGGGGGKGGAGGAGGAEKAPDDPLQKFMVGIGLPQYASILRKQHVDLDVLECTDDDDIKNFGVKDAAHVQLIKSKIKDGDFLDKCRSSKAVAAPASAAGDAGAAAGKPISLEDDDDDLLLGGGGGNDSKAAFAFDDSDDDLLAPAGSGGGVRLSLDSDDDLDLAPAGKPISLDSDDDI